jgi:hypothetical protein
MHTANFVEGGAPRATHAVRRGPSGPVMAPAPTLIAIVEAGGGGTGKSRAPKPKPPADPPPAPPAPDVKIYVPISSLAHPS